MLSPQCTKRFAVAKVAVLLLVLTYSPRAQTEQDGPAATDEAGTVSEILRGPSPINELDTVEQYEEQISNDPADPVNYNNLAALYIRSGRYEEGLETLKKAVKAGPDISTIRVNLSLVYNRLGRKEDALRSAHRAVDIDAKNARARLNLCTLYNLSDRFRDAANCFETLIPMMPDDPIINLGYAFAAFKAGSVERTITILEKVVAKNPAFAAAYNLLGTAQYKKKKFSAALASYKNAVELAPHVSFYRFNLGMTQMTRRNKAAALSQYRLVKEKNPTLAARMYRYIYADKLVFVGDAERLKPR